MGFLLQLSSSESQGDALRLRRQGLPEGMANVDGLEFGGSAASTPKLIAATTDGSLHVLDVNAEKVKQAKLSESCNGWIFDVGNLLLPNWSTRTVDDREGIVSQVCMALCD